MPSVSAYGAASATSPLAPITIERREPCAEDVQIGILFCGVCHSDIHTARSEWPGVSYPAVPGHEIVGKVTAVGSDVSKFAIGDLVGVGCLVDSCRKCEPCSKSEENYCDAGMIGTYNSNGKDGNTLGGYSKSITVAQDYVLKISHPEEQLDAVAPLLCAGITLYSPLRHWGTGPGKKVGIVGLGGLGHMGVKIAAALGAEVTLFTTSESKREDGHRLGAKHVVNTKCPEQMAAAAGTLNLIVNTVSVSHNLDPFLKCLARDGTLCLVGAPEHPHPSPSATLLIFRRLSLAGSVIGGIKETQEMLDFCAEHKIVSDIEKIAMADINAAYDRVVKSDVKYRFVIDMATLE